MSLRRKLAEHGFESNDDYSHAVRCLLEQPPERMRVLHVDGQAGRRKTAFAQALGAALEYPRVLYHDFGDHPGASGPVSATHADGTEPPLSAFERVMTEACAYSEGEPTLLILDQLQAAPFAEHLRLHRFVDGHEWSNALGTVRAHPRNFLLVLISEQPLYHSLARRSFRVWADAQRGWQDFRPADYGMGNEATGLFDALGRLFEQLETSPTPSEFADLLDDLVNRVRSEDGLRQSLFGRIEAMERERLQAPQVAPALRAVLDEVADLLGAEHVELGA